MKSIIKTLIVCCAFLSTQAVFAQTTYYSSPFGFNNLIYRSPVQEVYLELKGNPFLLTDWAKGSITTSETVVDNLNILYNEVDDQLIFKTSKSNKEKVVLPVKEFTLVDETNGNATRKFSAGFAPTSATDEHTFFEVLVNGNTKLLKKNLKSISQNREYSGKIANTVIDDTNYYLVAKDNKLVKLNKKNINKFLMSENRQLADYVQSNALHLKKEDDLIKLFNYYNTL